MKNMAKEKKCEDCICKETEILRHNNKMIEFEKQIEIEKLKFVNDKILLMMNHEKILERLRIENAEKRKFEEIKSFHIREARQNYPNQSK